MIILKLKKKISAALIILVLAAQLTPAVTILITPQPAEACQFLGTGPTCSFTLVDFYRILEKIGIGILERVAQNYANKYLSKFVQQVSDKYRIKNFLFYQRYLTNYYLTDAILKDVQDPNLRRADQLMLGVLVTGETQGYTGADPRAALIPQLKAAIANLYVSQGGIDPNQVYNPAPGVTDQQYFATAQTYYSNPPSYTAQNLRGQFGPFQSSATTASQLEIMVGNSLKAGRIIGGTCSVTDWDPTAGQTDPNKDPNVCAARGGVWNESAFELAQDLITDPTGFIDSHINSAFKQIFANNFDSKDIYTQIGQSLGGFLYDQLNLYSSGGTVGDGGSGYDPNTSGGATIGVNRQVDLDHDSIIDGQENDTSEPSNQLSSALDTCYFPNPNRTASTPTQPDTMAHPDPVTGAHPAGCALSSNTPSAWKGLCLAYNNEIVAMDQLKAFILRNYYQVTGSWTMINGGNQIFTHQHFLDHNNVSFNGDDNGTNGNGGSNLTDNALASVWSDNTQQAENTTQSLITTLKESTNINATDINGGTENQYFLWADLDNYLTIVITSLNGDHDFHHSGAGGFSGYTAWIFGGFGNGQGDGGYDGFAHEMLRNIQGQCGNPDPAALAAVPPPTHPPVVPLPELCYDVNGIVIDCGGGGSGTPTPCTQQGTDEQNFALPKLNAIPAMNPVVSPPTQAYQDAVTGVGVQVDQHFNLSPAHANSSFYDPGKNNIGWPEWYASGPTPGRPVSPSTGAQWDVTIRCSAP